MLPEYSPGKTQFCAEALNAMEIRDNIKKLEYIFFHSQTYKYLNKVFYFFNELNGLRSFRFESFIPKTAEAPSLR